MYPIKNFYERLQAVADSALSEVMGNIYDVNTSESAKRKIQINIVIAPRENRSRQEMTIGYKTTLAPQESIEVSLLSGQDLRTGEIVLTEYQGQMFGQVGLDEPDADSESGEILEDNVLDLRKAQSK